MYSNPEASPERWSSKSVPRSVAAASPGNLLEIQILGTHFRQIETDTPGWGSVICVFTRLPGNSDALSSFENHSPGM